MRWVAVALGAMALAGAGCGATGSAVGGRGVRIAGDVGIPLDALKARRARYADVEITVDEAAVPARDRAVLVRLVRAAEVMHRIFWRQATHFPGRPYMASETFIFCPQMQ